MQTSAQIRNEHSFNTLKVAAQRAMLDTPRSPCVVGMRGDSVAMQPVYQTIERVAPTSGTVFITGESGSGKELVAHAIHAASDRSTRPFVAINFGGIPANLVEAELFGSEKGSFTGASRQHLGCFERAEGGTLFLDEITEMPVEIQVRLLRVLESRLFFRVGGTHEIRTNVRIVAATNRDPIQAVKDGALREDLFYRLTVFPITLPPLRARTGDVRLLAESFLQELNAGSRTQKSFSSSALAAFDAHDWPGNVRELKNAVYHAYIVADDIVGIAATWSPSPKVDEPSGDYISIRVGTPLANVEQQVVKATLDHCQGSRKATAELLGISCRTLYTKLCLYQRGEEGVGSSRMAV